MVMRTTRSGAGSLAQKEKKKENWNRQKNGELCTPQKRHNGKFYTMQIESFTQQSHPYTLQEIDCSATEWFVYGRHYRIHILWKLNVEPCASTPSTSTKRIRREKKHQPPRIQRQRWKWQYPKVENTIEADEIYPRYIPHLYWHICSILHSTNNNDNYGPEISASAVYSDNNNNNQNTTIAFFRR